MSLQATTSQTVGPFFRIGMEHLYTPNLATGSVGGERITIEGRILDGVGVPIPDAVIEIWQANQHGKYDHPEDTQDKPIESCFSGFGRIATDEQGGFRFTTIKPGPVPGYRRAQQAPHLLVGIMMRGLLRRAVTRIYFPGEPLNEQDEILALVPAERRHTLFLRPSPENPGAYRWAIHMQGDDETVFFEIGS
jgi:protocatechuate 3,4-dioxygenase, alpha subunit